MIELILGPMFSGKSSELLQKVRRLEISKKKCLVLNYTHDNRYSDQDVMSTHDKHIHKAVKCTLIQEILPIYKNYDVIAIDEAQFFSDVVDMCEKFANQGKLVLVAALDGTFQRKPFGKILELIPKAEKVVKLSAVCMYCNKDAAFTQRTVDSCEIQLIGGEQSYKPTCRSCFTKKAPIPTVQPSPKKAISTSCQSPKSLSNPQTQEITA